MLMAFIVMQFFPIDKTNLPVDISKDFLALTSPDQKIRSMIKASCYDCHSHEANYPWYSNISPVSHWVKGHINSGLEHMNFSLWADYSLVEKKELLEACTDMMDKRWMPLLPYKLAHSEARLSKEQYASLKDFFEQSKVH